MIKARPEITLQPIGIIRTPFKQATGTPIQSSVARGAEGAIEVFAEYELGLRDIEGFERLWLIYQFDRASEPTLIVQPYLDRSDHGIFATRSPARPNKLGISSVGLLGVDGHRLRISDVDMLDGTPLLDIKPYVPSFDHFPVGRIGWFEGRLVEGATADDRFERKGEHKT
ncbi:MAG: tRNA (N6-threonylcarbamoyladenosine(37)-N6)-methyltransferase TrmO [Terriglobales bacterium]|jgi:tRNA-Thr(GGU) m(6)t(6)A37 methyltransferase TsaA